MDEKQLQRLCTLALSTDPGDVASFNKQCRATLPALLEVADSKTNDFEVARKCVTILKEFSFEDAANCHLLGTSGVVEIALRLAEKQVHDVGFVSHVFGLLVNLSVQVENRLKIVEGRGHHLVLKAMTTHTSSVEMQKIGCMLLRNLSCDSGPNQQLIVDSGAVDFLLRTSKAFTQHPEVQEQLLAALCHLSYNDDAKRQIVDSGGIPALLRAVFESAASPCPYLDKVLAVLVNLSLTALAQPKLVEASCVPTLLLFLDSGAAGATDPLILDRIFLVLGNLACQDHLRSHVVTHDTVEAAVRALCGPPAPALSTARVVMWALVNFLVDSEGAIERLQRAHGVNAIVAQLKAYHSDAELSLQGSKALLAVARTSGTGLTQVAGQAMGTIFATIQEHLYAAELVYQLSFLLSTVTANAASHEPFHADRGLAVVVEVLATYVDSKEMFALCCQILTNTVLSKEHQDDCLRRELLPAVLTGLSTHTQDEEAQTRACQLLAALTADNASVQEALADNSAVAQLARCYRQNAASTDLLKYYFGVLLNISVSDKTHSRLIEDGGLEMVVEAMRAHIDLPDLQRCCVRLLGNIVGNDVTVGAITAEVLQLLVKVMVTHIADRGVQIASCWVLEELSGRGLDMELIEQVGGLYVVRCALDRFTGDSAVLVRGLEVLANYAASPFERLRRLLTVDFLVLVLNTLFGTEVTERELSCVILGNMASVSQSFLLQYDVVSKVKGILFEDNLASTLRVEVVSCLTRMAAALDDLTVLEVYGGISTLQTLMTLQLPVGTQLSVRRAIQALAMMPTALSGLVTYGLPAALARDIRTSSDSDIVEADLMALALAEFNASEGALGPIENGLAALIMDMLATTDPRVAGTLFVLLGNAFARRSECARYLIAEDILQAVLSCYDGCTRAAPRGSAIATDLRLAMGYAVCSLMMYDEPIKERILASARATDLAYRGAEELCATEDVDARLHISHSQLSVCRAVLSLIKKDTVEGGVEPDTDLGAGGADHPTVSASQAEKANAEMILDAMVREAKAKRESWMEYLRAIRLELAMWEEQEEWERRQLDAEEIEGRRMLFVREAQHKKGVMKHQKAALAAAASRAAAMAESP
eukprot:RCo023050